jgi:hypothetical protein
MKKMVKLKILGARRNDTSGSRFYIFSNRLNSLPLAILFDCLIAITPLILGFKMLGSKMGNSVPIRTNPGK